jgi:tRNA A37 threonylcarbamoyladenosine synthetase subunit TsaC/SUA5/YrdC
MPSKYLKTVNTIKYDLKYLTFDLHTEPLSSDFAVREQVLSGNPVPICMGEVYALICDARDPAAVEKVRKIKNRPSEKTFGVLLDSVTISRIVDYAQIHKAHHKFFNDSNLINKLFGAKGFIRFPLNNEYDIPISVKADGIIQAFTFFGNDNAFFIEESLRRALKEKHPNGYGEILITSYNISGTGSITNKHSAHALTKSTDLGIHIDRSDSKGKGSYSIYMFGSQGVEKARHGTGSRQIDNSLKIEK